MKTKIKGKGGLRALSQVKQAQLQDLWNKRLVTPFVMIPKENKAIGVTPTEARKAQELFGKFANNYKRKVLARNTNDSDVLRRLQEGKILMSVGYGRGHGSRIVKSVVKAGLQMWSVDVSSVVWIWARTDLKAQFEAIPKTRFTSYLEPKVVTAEIQSLLAEPEKAELDLTRVEVWDLTRLLNCLSTCSAKIVLQEIGRITLSPEHNSSGRGAVVILNALSDENPESAYACIGTSIRRSWRMIKANLEFGAGCKVERRYIEHSMYFDQTYTAMTVMAKK